MINIYHYLKNLKHSLILSAFIFVMGLSATSVGGILIDYDGKQPSALRSYTHSDTKTEVVEVLNPKTGRIWMDRNLGANRAAISSTDAEAYGDLYQWGRKTDGHQKRNSKLTSVLSSSETSNTQTFIAAQNRPYDWLKFKADNLWQGIDGANNPCPVGFRLPTDSEWNDELATWGSDDLDGAYNSKLKLTAAGRRSHVNGGLSQEGMAGYYWSSTVSSNSSLALGISRDIAQMSSTIGRAVGYSIRCIKHEDETINIAQTTTPNTNNSTATQQSPPTNQNSPSSASLTKTMPVQGRDSETVVVDVINPGTGRTWMDRNLGASRTATSPNDEQSYGHMYQWGRAADGHQNRNSKKNSTISGSIEPQHNEFIISGSSPYDWISPKNDDLWQGKSGVNNPCPVGYRIPTEAEWIQERATWRRANADNAFSSPLKLPMAGYRVHSSGSAFNVSTVGSYWSSTSAGLDALRFGFNTSNANTGTMYRATGMSIRCIKD
jgi:uncharacterized protein (TIGR02145 family)